MAENPPPVLVADSLSVSFGGMSALRDLSFEVQRGEIMGLVGPNGAGKSTALNVITGHVSPRSGRLTVRGVIVRNMNAPRRARLGMARTFQNLELFSTMTVYENVRCAARREGSGADRRKWIDEILGILGLADVAGVVAAELPYGTRKLVELARVFVSKPALVLLDEPVAGLNHDEKAEFVAVLRTLIARFDLSGVLVEHDMPTVRAICSRLVVLDAGAQIAHGPVESTLRDPAVIAAYLGPLALSADTPGA